MLKVKPFHSFKNNDGAGFSLVGILIGIGIMGILVTALMATFSNNIQQVMIVQKLGELEDLRRFIRMTHDCTQTFTYESCNGQQLNIRYSSGQILIPRNVGKKIGKYTCNKYDQITNSRNFGNCFE